MKRAELHLITTGKQPLEQVTNLLDSLSFSAKVAIDALHIREKQRTAREVIEWYMCLRKRVPSSCHIYINDRIDAAWAVRAEGVQLAWHSISISDAKQMLPANCRIGCSVHSVDEAQHAAHEGANFLLYGHIFESASKAGLPGRGVDALQQVVSSVHLPVIAIGGIDASNAGDVMKSGCTGVAVMSAFFFSEDPNAQLLQLRDALDTYCTR